jgi:hypothetical protein
LSEVIEDINNAFTGFTRNIFTVFALIAGVAVLSMMLPVITKLVSTITGLAQGGATLSSSLGNTSSSLVNG